MKVVRQEYRVAQPSKDIRSKRQETGARRGRRGQECKTEGLDLPCRDGGSTEGHEQVDPQKADTINSEL